MSPNKNFVNGFNIFFSTQIRFDKFKLTEKNGKLEDEDTLKNGDPITKEVTTEKSKTEEIKSEEAVEA